MSLAGSRLGPYEIASALGAGGMGEVYRARDTKLGRDVAIKILPAAFSADPERLARFEREARVLASLNHPHISAIYGFENANGVHALVLELVEGETLAERLRRKNTGLGIRDSLAIARQIADALDAAHERGIVHRDLKPANIAITADGIVKVLDFGLAKPGGSGAGQAEGDEPTNSPTMIGPTVEGVLLGTAPYMSPEQARGKTVDKRTDVWAFGCVVYEMLTGRRAFTGETTADVVAKIVEREPDWTILPDVVPPNLERLLRRCLEKDVRKRLRDIADAAPELDPAAPDNSRQGVSSGRGWRIATAASAFLALAAVLALFIQSLSRAAATPSFSTSHTVASTLTNYGGHETDGAVSPDGRSFVFVSDHGGTPDVWLRQVSGGEPVRLTNDAAVESNLAFAPDGETIYFARTDGPESAIWRIGALGGQSRKVLAGHRSFAISPDGRSVAVFDFRDGNPNVNTELVVSAVDGSGRRTLARDVLATQGVPSWAPDGRRLLFLRGGLFEPRNLFMVDISSGRERQLTTFRGLESIGSHVWLPDGRHVVVSYVPFSRQVPPNDLGILDVEEGSLTRLTLSTHDTINSLSLSADGSKLLATTVHTEREVWKVPLGADPEANGRAAIRLMDSARQPMWTFVSRDGRTLLFDSPVSGSWNLWTWPLDGSAAPHQVTAIPQDAVAHSSLSPDGSHVAFASTATGNSDIWTQNVDGTELRQLTNDAPADSWPIWSPDGQWIAYSSLRDTRETWRIPSRGGTPERVMDGFLRGDWMEAPGGGTRIVTSDGGGSVRMIDVDRRTIVWTKRLGGGGSLTLPQFSPDGRRVSLPFADGRNRDAIWILDAATGEGHVAVRFPAATQIYFRASWVDNGAALVFNAYRNETHVQLFDRFWTRDTIDRK